MRIVADINKAAVVRMLMDANNEFVWSILTADKDGDSPENLAENRRFLLHMLERRKFEYLLVDGYYDGKLEQAVFVIGMDTNSAVAFSLFYGQDAFLTSKGLYYIGASGWYQCALYAHRHVVDGILVSTRYDKSVIHCSDGDLTFMAEI